MSQSSPVTIGSVTVGYAERDLYRSLHTDDGRRWATFHGRSRLKSQSACGVRVTACLTVDPTAPASRDYAVTCVESDGLSQPGGQHDLTLDLMAESPVVGGRACRVTVDTEAGHSGALYVHSTRILGDIPADLIADIVRVVLAGIVAWLDRRYPVRPRPGVDAPAPAAAEAPPAPAAPVAPPVAAEPAPDADILRRAEARVAEIDRDLATLQAGQWPGGTPRGGQGPAEVATALVLERAEIQSLLAAAARRGN